MGAALDGNAVGGVGLLVPARSLIPKPEMGAGFAVAEILQAPFGADDGVVAPVVGGIVALRVGGEDAVIELHLHGAQILDVDAVVEAAEFRRREKFPVLLRHVDPPRSRPRRLPAREVAVQRERPEGVDQAAVAAAQPVDDIDVVRGLLQEQAVDITALGVPVAEIEVAAVAHKMPAPAGLHLADHALVNERLHLPDKGHVAHVVADIEPHVVLFRGGEDAVACGGAERHGLFEVEGVAVRDGGQGLLLVEEIRRADDDGVEIAGQQGPVIVGGENVRAEFRAVALQRRRADIAAGRDAGAAAGLMGGAGEIAAATAGADDAELEIRFFHVGRKRVKMPMGGGISRTFPARCEAKNPFAGVWSRAAGRGHRVRLPRSAGAAGGNPAGATRACAPRMRRKTAPRTRTRFPSPHRVLSGLS